jgi:hypothetical protein
MVNLQRWQDQCGVYLGTRWWPSRIRDYQVCWWCTDGNPLQALVVLARRQSSAAVARAECLAIGENSVEEAL